MIRRSLISLAFGLLLYAAVAAPALAAVQRPSVKPLATSACEVNCVGDPAGSVGYLGLSVAVGAALVLATLLLSLRRRRTTRATEAR